MWVAPGINDALHGVDLDDVAQAADTAADLADAAKMQTQRLLRGRQKKQTS